MFDVLNSYLFQHKSISIPGLGTIYMETLPASVDASTKNMLPPLFYFRFDKYFDAPDREFFSYLANQQKIPDYEALRLYSEFSYVLREKINREEKVYWQGVGELKKNEEGSIVFESTLGNPFFLQPVPAEKVVHPDAKHVLLVGDTERTNVEMNEWLQQETEPRKKRSWWIFALIIGVIALSVLIFHFSSHGWRVDSAGNQQGLQVEK
jgi:nucleoid DNA-binding protein